MCLVKKKKFIVCKIELRNINEIERWMELNQNILKIKRNIVETV